MPKDNALIAELMAPTYAFTSTGKMVVERTFKRPLHGATPG